MFTTASGGPRQELGAKRLELATDRAQSVRPGLRPVAAVQDVEQHGGALDVRQEAVPEAGALAGALDEPGDIGQHDGALVELKNAEIRLDRGERIGGDLGARPGESRQKRGLAGVRQPDEADVGEQLQRQREPELIAVQTLLGELRRLARGALETDVAAAALAAARDQQPLALAHEVAQEGVVGVAHLGADGHLDRRARRLSAPCLLAPRPGPPLAARKWCL